VLEFAVAISTKPLLTVILIAGNYRDRVQRALRSILNQDMIDQLAVVVYDRAFEPVRDLPEFDHPNVAYKAVERDTTLGQLQKQSVLATETEFIAFIEEHVTIPPNWARECLSAHAEGYAGVTGIFVAGNGEYHWARIGFLMTYGAYMFPTKGGESVNIPADNSSFVRSKLLRLEQDLELLFNTDVLLTRRLAEEGEKLYRVGDLSLAHSNERTFRAAWVSLFYWNQMYACNLVVTERWSFLRRAFRFFSMPAAPLVRTLKGLVQAWQNSADMKQWFRDAPSVFLLHVGSAAGMTAGLLLGYQRSEWKFTDCETSAPR
jgi:glycosyltransferase involved in cell wall biosynthesis